MRSQRVGPKPKHVSLGMTVKNLTGSAQVISLLNKFGHYISHNDVLEIESSMAKRQLNNQESGVVLPTNIHAGQFTTFCYDNNDFKEHTLSGSNTTHCTNGILIQRRSHTCAPPPKQQPESEHQEVPLSYLGMPMNFIPPAGDRATPYIMNIDMDIVLDPTSDHFPQTKASRFRVVSTKTTSICSY